MYVIRIYIHRYIRLWSEVPYPDSGGSTAGRYFHFPFWLQLWIKITSSSPPVDLRPPTESLDRALSKTEEFCGWFMKRKKSYCKPSVVSNFPESRKSSNGYDPPPKPEPSYLLVVWYHKGPFTKKKTIRRRVEKVGDLLASVASSVPVCGQTNPEDRGENAVRPVIPRQRSFIDEPLRAAW